MHGTKGQPDRVSRLWLMTLPEPVVAAFHEDGFSVYQDRLLSLRASALGKCRHLVDTMRHSER